MPTKIQGGLGIDKVQDGTVGMSNVDTELYGKITALTTINLGEAKTATGTVVDFDVPEGVKRVTVMFDGVSTNGTSNKLLRLGSGGIENTGYATTVTSFSTTALGTGNRTDGFEIGGVDATDVIQGQITLNKITGNTWAVSGYTSFSSIISANIYGGSKTLSGTIDRIRITTVNGTDQFDAGIINISWEF